MKDGDGFSNLTCPEGSEILGVLNVGLRTERWNSFDLVDLGVGAMSPALFLDEDLYSREGASVFETSELAG